MLDAGFQNLTKLPNRLSFINFSKELISPIVLRYRKQLLLFDKLYSLGFLELIFLLLYLKLWRLNICATCIHSCQVNFSQKSDLYQTPNYFSELKLNVSM